LGGKKPQPGIKPKAPGERLTVPRAGALAKARITLSFSPKPHHKLPLITVAAPTPGQALARLASSCLIPGFDGVILSLEWKEALWDKFVMAAPRPRTPSEQQYSDRKLRSRS